MMKLLQVYEQLKNQGDALLLMTAGLNQEQARWRPDEESWSLLEVLNHLVDEEVEDFRRHLDHVLHSPDRPWPEIDPQGWVVDRHYNQRDLQVSTAQFRQARTESVAWLQSLEDPDWDTAVNMPWGFLTAGDLLSSWLAHDLLHLRQLVALRYQLIENACMPYRLEYAGQW
jgi:hypothetical protein